MVSVAGRFCTEILSRLIYRRLNDYLCGVDSNPTFHSVMFTGQSWSAFTRVINNAPEMFIPLKRDVVLALSKPGVSLSVSTLH